MKKHEGIEAALREDAQGRQVQATAERAADNKRAKRAAMKALDARIEREYRARCNGVQIDLMDIPRVFAAGHKAAAEGRDIGEAVEAFVKTIARGESR